MGLIKALGLDGRILLAQFINFAILMFVLWRYAYKPVFKILEERKNKIHKSLDDVERATIRLQEAEVEAKKIILESRQEAVKILSEAQAKAEVKHQEIVKKAEEEISFIMEKERVKLANEKAHSLEQLKSEVAGLVMAALVKFLEDQLDEKKDQAVITKIVANLKDKA